MSKIFLIFVIVALVYCAGAENAEAGPNPGLEQAVSGFGIMPPMMLQMRNMMNPEYWKQQIQNGDAVLVKSYSPSNGKPSSEVTFLNMQDGQVKEKTITN